MNKDFLFSIIMPVYNTEKYIEKSLQSVYEAIDTDCEVIIVNDGSKDDSEKVILKFLENLPEKFKDNFVYTKKENKGLADTKNVGIEMSRGKYISVVDSDDCISKDFYKVAREYIKENYEIIIYDVYVVFENKQNVDYASRAYSDYKKDYLAGLLNGAISGSSCNKIIKKELYSEHQFPVGKEYEDTAVTPFILSETNKIKYLPYAMYYYLQREKSIVATNTLEMAFYKICENISKVISEKSKNNNEDEICKKYEFVINEFIIDRMLDYFISDYNLNKKEFINNIKGFSENNRNTIEYIIKNNLVNNIQNHYSARQKEMLVRILNYLKDNEYKNVVKELQKRKLLNYVRKIMSNMKQFIKAILGK